MSPDEKPVIAVDVGGTQLRAALYLDESLNPVKIARSNTRHPTETPLDRLISLIESIWPDDKTVTAIGVAAAGPLDPFEGIIFEAPNVPGWVDLPIKSKLEDCFHTTVALGNDANMAAIGEWRYGAGIGHHHVIYITVSTGIGGGIIVDDRLLLGVRGLAAEIGHITVLPDGPLCGCGHRGHLEALASGPAIARWVSQEISQGAHSILPGGETLSAKMIAEAARSGDELSIEAFDRAGTFLGRAVADFAHIFNPSIVIIGGGVSRAGPLLIEPMQAALRKYVISKHYAEELILTTAALGDEAGLVGAMALARSISQ
jgi:glucokinase